MQPQILEVGELVTLRGRFADAAGILTDPTAVEITITRPDGTTIVSGPVVTPYAPFGHTTVGLFTFALTVTQAGVWTYRYEGTGAIVAGETGYLIVNPVGQGGDRTGPCSNWASIDQLQACGAVAASVNEGQQEVALAAASDLLWRWSGYKYGGICMDTVRPCAQNTNLDLNLGRWSNSTWGEWSWAGYGSMGDCACQANVHRDCGCSWLSEVRLGRAPVQGIAAVKVDGATLAPSAYRIDDYEWLVRIDGNAWPCCQDLTKADTQPNTWSVSYFWGKTPPASGVVACVDLTTEIVKACAAGSCDIPENTSQIMRQGETMLFMPPDFAGKLRANIRSVDRFLEAVGTSRPMVVASPDIGSPVRRTG